ncbi:hypothetical protein ABK040_015638 [Willaertia magna]
MRSVFSEDDSNINTSLLGDKSITNYSESETIPNVSTSPTTNPIATKKFDNEGITTIDWRSDHKKEKSIRAKIYKEKGIKGLIKQGLYASQGWTVTFVVGVTVGIFASIVDIGSEWISGLKQGVCLHWFWATQKRCCIDVGENCPYWKTWSELVGIYDETGSYIFNYFAYTLAAVIFAVISAWFVKVLAPWAAGSGLPEVKTILGGFVIKGCLGIWTLLVKVIGLVLSVGSGLTLGKEGPMVHVGCCCGNIASRLFPKYRLNEAKKREVLSASCAAGVTCAFGTPAGGTLFSLEETSSYFPPKTLFRTFFTAIIGALTLQVLNPRITGKIVLYSINYHVNWKWFELLPFLFLGVIGGLFGALFTKLNIWFIVNVRKKYLKNWGITEVIFTTIITSLICFWNEYTRMSMTDLIANLFGNTCTSTDNNAEEEFQILCDLNNSWPIAKLFLAFLLRFLLMTITIGMKLPAGMYVPSLCLGAVYGHITGTVMKYIQENYSDNLFFQECTVGGEGGDCVVPGIYALIGAATMLAGMCRITVSLAVIMFELTGGLEYLVPIMLAIVVAKWVGDAFNKENIYELLIEMNEYPYLQSEEIDNEGTAKTIMTTNELKVIFAEGVTMGDIKGDLLDENCKVLYGFPVVDNPTNRCVLGYVTRNALLEAIKLNETRINDQTEITFEKIFPLSKRQQNVINKIDLSSFLDEIPIQIPSQMPGDRIYDMFRAMGIRYCLVLHNSKLVGIITKKDLVRWYHNGNHSIELVTKSENLNNQTIVDMNQGKESTTLTFDK